MARVRIRVTDELLDEHVADIQNPNCCPIHEAMVPLVNGTVSIYYDEASVYRDDDLDAESETIEFPDNVSVWQKRVSAVLPSRRRDVATPISFDVDIPDELLTDAGWAAVVS